jgi:hypothetical protein
MPDSSEDPHQSCRAIAACCLAISIYCGQVTHVRAGPPALWSALVNRGLILEIGCMMAEQNAILNISHSGPLWIKMNYVIRAKAEKTKY